MGHLQNAVFILIIFVSALCPAQDNLVGERVELIRQQIEALNREIDEFKALLDQTHNERSQIEDELRRNETEMADLLKEIRGIEQQLHNGDDKLETLKGEEQELNDAKIEQQEYIIEQIRSAYVLGSQENLKVLLNQQDPAEIARMLTYYDYFNRARADQIERYAEILGSLDRIQRNIESEVEKLSSDRDRLRVRQNRLTSTREARQQTLTNLNTAIQSRGSALEKMTLDRGALEELLETLAKQLAQIPEVQEVTPFPELKGKMRLPVNGAIANRFGSQRVQGKLTWQGVFIAAKEGSTVHAIHHGRVVFSDWLRGFGLLMIVNHGDGFMSLYGHNQTLERETGDWVTQDEVISTAGNSGGQNRFGVYFEIRQGGRPQNPENWCLARA